MSDEQERIEGPRERFLAEAKRPVIFTLLIAACAGWLVAFYLLWSSVSGTAAHRQQLTAAQSTRSGLAELAQQLQTTQNDLKAAQTALGEATKLRDEQVQYWEQLKGQAKEAEQQLADARGEVTSVEKTVVDQRAELRVVNENLEAARQQEAQAREHLEVLTRDASHKADELAGEQKKIQLTREKTATADQQLSALRTKISEVGQQLVELNKVLESDPKAPTTPAETTSAKGDK